MEVMTTAATFADVDFHAPVVDAVLDAAVQMLGMEVVFLGSVSESMYEFHRVVGDVPGFVEGLERPMSDTLCEAMLTGSPPPATSDARSVGEYADRMCVTDLGVASYIGVAVLVHGQVVGTLCGIDRDRVMVAPDQLALLKALSAVIGAHVETGTVLRRSATGWQVGPEDDLDLTSAMTLADLLADDVATVGRPPRPDDDPQTETERLRLAVTQLEHALAARVIVEQAIGVLAERLGRSPRSAFEQLRKASRTRGLRVHDVARDVVAAVTDPTVQLPPELTRG
jgi:GAF domain-containing protein